MLQQQNTCLNAQTLCLSAWLRTGMPGILQLSTTSVSTDPSPGLSVSSISSQARHSMPMSLDTRETTLQRNNSSLSARVLHIELTLCFDCGHSECILRQHCGEAQA